MSESYFKEFGLEPKNVFVNSLILVSRQIEYSLYFEQANVTQVLPQLQGLIDMLDKKSQKELKNITDKITNYRFNTSQIKTRIEIEQLYSQITAYLHETYLKEVRVAIPKFGKTKVKI